jgi:hypothetical protein
VAHRLLHSCDIASSASFDGADLPTGFRYVVSVDVVLNLAPSDCCRQFVTLTEESAVSFIVFRARVAVTPDGRQGPSEVSTATEGVRMSTLTSDLPESTRAALPDTLRSLDAASGPSGHRARGGRSCEPVFRLTEEESLPACLTHACNALRVMNPRQRSIGPRSVPLIQLSVHLVRLRRRSLLASRPL